MNLHTAESMVAAYRAGRRDAECPLDLSVTGGETVCDVERLTALRVGVVDQHLRMDDHGESMTRIRFVEIGATGLVVTG